MKYARVIQSPIGPLTLVEEDAALTELRFDNETQGLFPGDTPLLREAAAQLAEYFSGRRRAFDLPLRPKGTPFQLRCWDALLQIPFGETRTYGQQAAMIGNPKACRAVGMANHHNPLPVLIPCHRVVGANGSLTGYGGGLGIKETLLQIERMKPE
ncbi:MAG: methylated-DNA--[protein]-cysteine S-methyltransferase [Clostridia bacterium]|nr:methylated-DNA--[protein]-cysteine S-methyltransferase [Clostridia bacterium]